VGLLKTLVDANRKVSFRAVTKGELNVYVAATSKSQVSSDSRYLNRTKDLNGEENLVFGHIKAVGNEGILKKLALASSVMIGTCSPKPMIGIWTKHLKTKTNLHQTVIDRCLKTLAQKRLVKRVPSVQV